MSASRLPDSVQSLPEALAFWAEYTPHAAAIVVPGGGTGHPGVQLDAYQTAALRLADAGARVVVVGRDAPAGEASASAAVTWTGRVPPAELAALLPHAAFVVTNGGGRTAEGLRVEIALIRDGQDVEVADVTFAFVPRASHREAWALFRNDPRQFRIDARAIGFEKP